MKMLIKVQSLGGSVKMKLATSIKDLNLNFSQISGLFLRTCTVNNYKFLNIFCYYPTSQSYQKDLMLKTSL